MHYIDQTLPPRDTKNDQCWGWLGLGPRLGKVLLGGCDGLMVHYPCVTCYTRLAGAQIEEEMTIGSDGRQNEIWPCPCPCS